MLRIDHEFLLGKQFNRKDFLKSKSESHADSSMAHVSVYSEASPQLCLANGSGKDGKGGGKGIEPWYDLGTNQEHAGHPTLTASVFADTRTLSVVEAPSLEAVK